MGKRRNEEFISIVWHELRTPLSSIRGYLSMIIEWDMWEISDEARKALNHCYDSSVRMINIVNDVLALSKVESWKMEYYNKEIDIVSLAKSVYNDMYLESKSKKVDFEIEIDKQLIDKKIFVDEDKIKQVFINLINNAIKFTDVWWKVILKATKQKDNKVLFEVIDNWIGIPKNKQKMIFDKFTQVESSLQRENASGLGLGLALSKNFVKDFGSELNLKSKFGEWSNFYFELKLV